MKDEIFIFIGNVVAVGGGAAVAAYALFIFLGKKWIENKFSQNLVEYKSAQQKELEDFKFKINTLFNRITKIHEKEMEVLPECWSKLYDTKEAISALVHPIQEYPNFNTMTEEKIREWLKGTDLANFQTEELIKEKDKNEYYINTIFWYRLHKVQKKCFDLHNYIMKNRIFLSEDLKKSFTDADDLLWDVLADKQIGETKKDYKIVYECHENLNNNIGEIIETIEQQVQKRLHYHSA